MHESKIRWISTVTQYKSFMLFVRNILEFWPVSAWLRENGNQQNAKNLNISPPFQPPRGTHVTLTPFMERVSLFNKSELKIVIVCGQLDDEWPGWKGWQEAHVLIHLYLIMINRLHEIYWLLPGGNSKALIATPSYIPNLFPLWFSTLNFKRFA